MATHIYFIFVACSSPTITPPLEDGSEYEYMLGDSQTFEMSLFDVDDAELSV